MTEQNLRRAKEKKIYLSYHQLLLLKDTFGGMPKIISELNNVTPMTDVVNLMRYINSEYDNKEFDKQTYNKIQDSRELKSLLAVGQNELRNDELTNDERRAIRVLLVNVKEKWLYRYLSIIEIKSLLQLNYNEIPDELQKLVKKYNRPLFK